MTIKDEIQEAITFRNFCNPNSWVRKCFELFLEGSYGEHNKINYKMLELRVSEKKSSSQKMKVFRSFIIENFSKFGAIEFNCSRGYFQKVMVQTFSKDELKVINKILVNEFLEEWTNPDGNYK